MLIYNQYKTPLKITCQNKKICLVKPTLRKLVIKNIKDDIQASRRWQKSEGKGIANSSLRKNTPNNDSPQIAKDLDLQECFLHLEEEGIQRHDEEYVKYVIRLKKNLLSPLDN